VFWLKDFIVISVTFDFFLIMSDSPFDTKFWLD
jgi:hypothetical protein